jgi:hypothetical protein
MRRRPRYHLSGHESEPRLDEMPARPLTAQSGHTPYGIKLSSLQYF